MVGEHSLLSRKPPSSLGLSEWVVGALDREVVPGVLRDAEALGKKSGDESGGAGVEAVVLLLAEERVPLVGAEELALDVLLDEERDGLVLLLIGLDHEPVVVPIGPDFRLRHCSFSRVVVFSSLLFITKTASGGIRTPGHEQSYHMKAKIEGICRRCPRPATTRLCSECRHKETARAAKCTTLSGIFIRLLKGIKKGARKASKSRARLIPCDLTPGQLKDLWARQNGLCALTGLPMTFEQGLCSASLDRIDSSGAYSITNVMFTCKWVNLGRGAASVEDFKKDVLLPLAARPAVAT